MKKQFKSDVILRSEALPAIWQAGTKNLRKRSFPPANGRTRRISAGGRIRLLCGGLAGVALRMTTFLVLVSALSSLGFDWFGQPKKETKNSPKQESELSKKKSALQSASEPGGAAVPGSVPKIVTISTKPIEVFKPPVKVIQLPRKAAETVDVVKVQKQIKEIIDLNETLKAQYVSQAGEIHRITEQARIHQRLLVDLEKSRVDSNKLTEKDTEEILRQEKLRMIRDETEKNKKIIGDLKESSSPNSGARAKVS